MHSDALSVNDGVFSRLFLLCLLVLRHSCLVPVELNVNACSEEAFPDVVFTCLLLFSIPHRVALLKIIWQHLSSSTRLLYLWISMYAVFAGVYVCVCFINIHNGAIFPILLMFLTINFHLSYRRLSHNFLFALLKWASLTRHVHLLVLCAIVCFYPWISWIHHMCNSINVIWYCT